MSLFVQSRYHNLGFLLVNSFKDEIDFYAWPGTKKCDAMMPIYLTQHLLIYVFFVLRVLGSHTEKYLSIYILPIQVVVNRVWVCVRVAYMIVNCRFPRYRKNYMVFNRSANIAFARRDNSEATQPPVRVG